MIVIKYPIKTPFRALRLSARSQLSFLALSLLLLQGCVGTTAFMDSRAIADWQLSGKIGMVYPKSNCHSDNCSPKSDQGSIQWQQQQLNYDVTLSDPFGRVVMEIRGDDRQLQASSPGQAPIQTTPDAFIALLTDRSSNNRVLSELSPNDLRYWVTGRPNPDVPAKKSEQNFEQKGFVVTTRQWRKTAVGDMPSLITVVKDDFTLRLVVREWSPVTE